MSSERSVTHELIRSPKIMLACELAKAAHRGEKRASGEDYFTHHIEPVVNILINEFGIKDEEIICAAHLHDTVENTDLTLNTIKDFFGDRVMRLVGGVTKLKPDKSTPVYDKEVISKQNLKKLIKEGDLDIGIILIKLADNLHNASTYKYLDKEKRAFKARESYIYARIAEGYGMWKIMNKLKDYAFEYDNSKVYFDTINEINEDPRIKFNTYEKVKDEVGALLNKYDIDTNISILENGIKTIEEKKTKAIIQSRTTTKGLEYINDIKSIRVLTDNSPQCYQVLGIIHQHYGKDVDVERFDEFIAQPRINGYSALQTTINTANGPVEIAITTKEKEDFNMRGILSVMQKNGENTDLDDYKLKFIFSPDNNIIIAKPDATALDALYYLDPSIAADASGVLVDDAPHKLTDSIANGSNIVPILSDTPQRAPSAKYYKSILPENKNVMREQMGLVEKDRLVKLGNRILRKHLIPRGMVNISDNESFEQKLIYHFTLTGTDDLFVRLALRVIKEDSITKALNDIGITKGNGQFIENTTIVVTGKNQPGILKGISGWISEENGNIHSVKTKISKGNFRLRIYINGVSKDGETNIKRLLEKDSRFNHTVVV